jgi:hypothetical protein
MANIKSTLPSAPIPGENFTSDWGNYPWHRPPDINDANEAIEYVAGRLAESDDGLQYMSYLKAGISVAAVTDMILTLGIADGKWTIDFAILIAGPVARMVTIMAKSYNVDYELGIDTDSKFVPSESIRIEMDLTEKQQKEMKAEMENVEAPEEGAPADAGLMVMASPEEQNTMLGYGPDEEGDVEPDMTEVVA